jgi:hypothetical protein
VDMKLEVVVVPVSDVDRAKALLQSTGMARGRRFRRRRAVPRRAADAARVAVLDHLRHRRHVGDAWAPRKACTWSSATSAVAPTREGSTTPGLFPE